MLLAIRFQLIICLRHLFGKLNSFFTLVSTKNCLFDTNRVKIIPYYAKPLIFIATFFNFIKHFIQC